MNNQIIRNNRRNHVQNVQNQIVTSHYSRNNNHNNQALTTSHRSRHNNDRALWTDPQIQLLIQERCQKNFKYHYLILEHSRVAFW